MTRPIESAGMIAVVGAGIMGTSAAFALSRRGYKVTLIDRAEPGRTGPSFGNAGHVVGCAMLPLASPGIGLRALGMLSRGEGPLKMPLGQWPRLASWLWRFWRTSTGARHEAATAALTDIGDGAVDAAESLWTSAGIGNLLRRTPCLFLYDTEASFEADRPHWDFTAGSSRPSRMIDAREIRELEPAIAPVFARGVVAEPYAIVTDPFDVVTGMFKAAQDSGVTYERTDVSALPPLAQRYDAVLVTAGAWSPTLASTVGDNLPVEAERGYNLSYPTARIGLNHPLILSDRGIAVSPLTSGFRFGGWSELGGTALPPDPGIWKSIHRMADEIVPGLKGQPAREWMGHRPATPDSVPLLSRSAKVPNVFYAVGHGHYGLSLSAKTAGIMTELIAEAKDARYAAFSIRRFG